MASSNVSCQVCGSTNFDEENGLYYCTVCNTKLEGMVTISHEQAPASQRAVINIGGPSVKVAKTTGYVWSSYEGFNYVLVAQIRFLVKELGLPDDVRRVILALWANYLERVQVAFTKDEVKLPLFSRKRDLELFVKNSQTIESVHYTPRSRKAFDYIDIKSKRILFHDQIKLENDAFPKTRRSLENYKKLGREKILKSLAFSDDLKSPISPIMDDGKENENEIAKEIEESDWMEPDVLLDEGDSTSSMNGQPYTVPGDRMNDYSRQLHYLFSTGKQSVPCRTNNDTSLLNIDRMSMPFTLAFILISFRILNLDIHVCDILNWVDQGRLPYYNASQCLPDDWSQFSFDCRSFSPIFSPSSKSLVIKASNLCKFLKLSPLPQVDGKDLMIRMLYELNLPLDFHLIIYNNKLLREKFQKLLTIKEERVQSLPLYEVYVLLVILIILRKFFYIEDQNQLVYQCTRSLAFRETNDRFDPDLWIEYTNRRVNTLRLHYMPLWNEKTTRQSNIDVAFQFYNQVTHDWKTKNLTKTTRQYRYNEKAFRDKMKQLVYSGTIKEKSYLEFPAASFTFLTDATKFATEKLPDGILKEFLLTNFRNKSISYLTKGHIFIRKYEHIVGKGDINNKHYPDIVWNYLQLVSWMVHLDIKDLLLNLKTVEKYFFPYH